MIASKVPGQQAAVRHARSVVIGTVGHIDHGKTALVLALTGVDTDRLPEEKSRGITIDLGFASLCVENGGVRAELSLIDVPGHQALVHNMMAGAGGIEAVMLVIAANEGVKAQTIEHLAICSLLGVEHGLVVLTKRDAVNADRLRTAKAEVHALVQDTFLASAPVLPVSARTGAGLAELKLALLQLTSRLPERSSDFVLRLPLDRAFSIPGFGTVVTGTLRDGQVQAGETVQLQPADRSVRVRGLQVHNRQLKEAHGPTRAALNLAGIEVGETGRGDTIVASGTLVPVSMVDVEFSVLPGARAVHHRSRLSLHAFTSEAVATVLLYDSDPETENGRHLARLRLSKPLLLVPGDRFVLRQQSPAELVGGGRVLDTSPLPRLRKAATSAWLRQIQPLATLQQIVLRVARHGMRGLSLASLVRETGLNKAALQRITAELVIAGRVVGASVEHLYLDHFIQPEAIQSAVDLLFRELSRKQTRSASAAELQSRTGLLPWVFDLAVRRFLETRPVRVRGTEFSINTSDPGAEAQTKLLARVEEQYRSAGLASPLVSEAASALRLSQGELQKQTTLLLRSGRLVRMGADNLLMHVDALAGLRADLAGERERNFDVGWFKTHTKLTRKHVIPILEYLDRTRVTINRQGIRTIL